MQKSWIRTSAPVVSGGEGVLDERVPIIPDGDQKEMMQGVLHELWLVIPMGSPECLLKIRDLLLEVVGGIIMLRNLKEIQLRECPPLSLQQPRNDAMDTLSLGLQHEVVDAVLDVPCGELEAKLVGMWVGVGAGGIIRNNDVITRPTAALRKRSGGSHVLDHLDHE
jgi:hypothetical protein